MTSRETQRQWEKRGNEQGKQPIAHGELDFRYIKLLAEMTKNSSAL